MVFMAWRRSLKLEKSEIVRRFNELSPRERLFSAGGAIVVLLYGSYELFYVPLAVDNLSLRQKIESQRQNYQYMQQISRDVSGLRQRGDSSESSVEPEGQSLLSLIDHSSQQLKLKPTIKRLLPEGADKVTLWLEDVAFDKLIYWLAVLESKHRLSVIQIDVEQTADLGLVKAKILLGGKA